MLEQLFAVARNTFFESIRQPIVLVILTIATIALILANPLSAFTMEDDQRMLIDLGLATIFLCGALLAAFVATGVLTREIENRTALTVISKPISRPVFVVGKFLGVGAALLLATLYMAFVFLLVERHSVLQTVRDPINVPVIVFGVGGGILGVIAAAWANYFYHKVFASTVIVLLTPILALAYLMSLMFRHDFTPQPIAAAFRPDLWLGLITLAVAILVLTAIAIAASARLGQVMTLLTTLGVFLLGLLSDHLLGRRIAAINETWLKRAEAEGLVRTEEIFRTFTLSSGEVQRSPVAETVEIATVPLSSMAQGAETLVHGLWTTLYAIVPNFQVLWLSDALTQDHMIPRDYVGLSIVYGLLQVGIALAIAVFLFQRREVG